MSIPTCAVLVRLYDQGAQAVVGAKVTAKLDRYEIYQGFAVPREVEGVTDAFGECTLSLFPNVLGAAGSSYKIKISPTGGLKAYSALAVVPDAPSANLDEIAELVAEPKADFQQFFEEVSGLASDLVGQATAAKVAAQAAQTAAAGSATAGAGSAASAGTQAAAALASSQSATTSANASEASRVNAATSEGNAAGSAAAAAGSATASAGSAATATTQAGNAAASATAAAGSATAAAGSATTATTQAGNAAASATAAAASAAAAAASAGTIVPTVTKPGNADVTTGRVVDTTVIYDVAITAPRTVTLNTTNPATGDRVHVTRTAAAAGADLVGVAALKYLNPGQWARATYDGAAWVLTAYGSL
ncbi:hypothetical protein [Cupriavidus sp. UYPR2.512]|uniref:hypothetical protein n=1 Tax=Cupriavidus sp. UYPR2.512 TaxID=1080187 RepID=UPI00035CC94A|nr:hypothetical protein [Cupriavidus sp. UYPR2.512]UIF90855.1 hypothetical protein KAF44_32215 [Cupriavidus necator]